MTAPLTRRAAFALAAAALTLTLSAPAHAAGPADLPLSGTWGGTNGDLTAQIIIAGDQLIAFYWRGDYADTTDAAFSDAGAKLTFHFIGGQATLTRTTDRAALLEVTEHGQVMRLNVTKD